ARSSKRSCPGQPPHSKAGNWRLTTSRLARSGGIFTTSWGSKGAAWGGGGVGGDATGKGMPAALVMATTRGMLRAVAQTLNSPGEVLARVNDALYPDIPSEMFVTCFYAILDPMSGHLVY